MAMRGEGRGCPVKAGRRAAPCGRSYWMLGYNRNVYICYSQRLDLADLAIGRESYWRRSGRSFSLQLRLRERIKDRG
jgi:hypothetical protein